jgi:hypothetical protein
MTGDGMHTVVETNHYAARAARVLSPEEQDRVIGAIAANPLRGVVMRDTGGVRKLRVALQGRGKSGGARVIYYYHDPRTPIFMLDVFAKNQRVSLTRAERNEMAKVAAAIKQAVRQAQEMNGDPA